MGLKVGYKHTEIGDIPTDWEVWPVKRMGEVITGKALAAWAPGRQRPYLRTKNVFDGYIDISDVLTMPMSDAQFAQFMVQEGDLLLNEGQSLELVGRCAMYRNEYPEHCAFQNQLLRFRARPGTDRAFACQLFRHCQHTGAFARIALQTTSIAHLGGKRFENFHLAWPSTEDEQRAIGAALDDTDHLIEQLDRLIAKKRDLKQAAMQQLLTGRTRLPGFKGKWDTKRLGDVVDTDPENLGASTPRGLRFNYIALEDVDRGVLRSFTEHVLHLAPSRARRWLRHNDVLVSTVRPNLQSHLLFRATPGVWVCSTGFCVVRCRPRITDPAFIFSKFFGHEVTRQIDALLTGSNYPAINSADVRALGIYMPGYEEQVAVSQVLSDMDAESAALESRRDKTRLLKQGMMQELLAGRVRLVPHSCLQGVTHG